MSLAINQLSLGPIGTNCYLVRTSSDAVEAVVVDPGDQAGEIERELRLSQPSVSKHLRVLRDAGFVESRIEAQRRLYRLRPEPLMELDEWLAPFRRFWSKHVDALEQHLDKMEMEPSVKGKKRHE